METETVETKAKSLKEFLTLLNSRDLDQDVSRIEWFENLRKQFDLKGKRDCKENYGTRFTVQGYLYSDEKERLKEQGLFSDVLETLLGPLLNHDWKEALLVLQHKAEELKGDPGILWKVGCELISKEQNNDKRCALMKEFYNEMKQQADVNSKEMLLDYLLFAFKHGDREAIQSELQKVSNQESEEESADLEADDLRQAYQGFFNYLEYKHCLKQQEHLMTQAGLNDSLSVTRKEMRAKEYATRAVKSFSGIEELDGVWDIFIEKFVEVLLYSGRQPDALRVLQDYSQHQKNNLNAQKYLYYFYINYYSDMEAKILQQLKVVSSMNPADPLVLEYCMTVGDTSIITSSLFQLLDYPVWQDNKTPWKLMANCLKRICIHKEEGTEGAEEVVQNCWKIRKTWWPAFHFTQYTLKKDSYNDFTRSTAKVLTEGGYSKKIKRLKKFHTSVT